eukprot:scaffold119190_cov53-Prasinocladus_malaysianus.AAC.1
MPSWPGALLALIISDKLSLRLPHVKCAKRAACATFAVYIYSSSQQRDAKANIRLPDREVKEPEDSWSEDARSSSGS